MFAFSVFCCIKCQTGCHTASPALSCEQGIVPSHTLLSSEAKLVSKPSQTLFLYLNSVTGGLCSLELGQQCSKNLRTNTSNSIVLMTNVVKQQWSQSDWCSVVISTRWFHPEVCFLAIVVQPDKQKVFTVWIHRDITFIQKWLCKELKVALCVLPLEPLPQDGFLKGWTKFELFSHLSLVMKGWGKNTFFPHSVIFESLDQNIISFSPELHSADLLLAFALCWNVNLRRFATGPSERSGLTYYSFYFLSGQKNFSYFTANCWWETNKDASCLSDLILEACFHDHNLAPNLTERNFFRRQHLPQSTKPVICSGLSWALLSWCSFPLSYFKLCFFLFELTPLPHRHPKFTSSPPIDFHLGAHVFGLETP